MLKILFATTASVATMAIIPAAWAQVAEPAADQSSAGIDEIVVTAQRKSENAQKAAIAIDAVTGDTLIQQGISKAEDITKSVPAITVTNGGGSNTSIFIRGVGNITSSSYNDPAVTPSYDGVVLGRAAGAFGSAFYDLARVEVLKGPQGILYGRTATGGAVNIIPARPELGKNGAGFNVSFGNYDAVNVDGYLNLATSDTSALRVAATRQVSDGYNRDGSDDLKRAGLRGQFLIEPSDDISLRIGADWTKVGGVGPGGSYIGSYTSGPAGYTFTPSPFDTSEGYNTAAANAYRQTLIGAPGFGFLTAMNQQQSVDYTYWGVNAELNWNTGLGTFTLVPAFRKSKGDSFFYGPAFNTAYNAETDKQYSLEARLAGAVGMMDYVVGGFYFNEKIDAQTEYNQESCRSSPTHTRRRAGPHSAS
jgi:iron complex outermembrane receptor protein